MRSGITKQRILAALLSLSMIFTVVGGGIAGRAGISAESDISTVSVKPPIAEFNFDDADNRLADSSGHGVSAQIVNSTAAAAVSTEKTNYLDLAGNDAYLSIPGSILKGVADFSVEMRVNTAAAKDPNWAFYAAPSNETLTWGTHGNREHYLGILLQDGAVTVERYANSGSRPENPSAAWNNDGWHTVKVLFGESFTELYIDGVLQSHQDGGHSLKDCISANGDYTDSIIYFGHANWGAGEGFNGGIDDIRIADGSGNLLLNLDFEGSGDERFADKFRSNIQAAVKNATADVISTIDVNNGYLDLTDQGNSGAGAYLSLDGNILKGLNEATIEMKVVTTAPGGSNWLFFAAPDDAAPGTNNKENYIGTALTPNIKVHRFANNSGARPPIIDTPAWPYTTWDPSGWHTVRVVFAENYTRLYIDGQSYAESTGSLKLSDCVGENGVLYFGHATWNGGQGFNGYIDDIKIWDYANDIAEPSVDDAEMEKHIITDDVVDPDNTVVNMFDYWITEQTANDYRPDGITSLSTITNGAINKDHPFVFMGWDSGKYSYSMLPVWPDAPNLWPYYGGGAYGNAQTAGSWNKNGSVTTGIVNKLLDNGYPVLSGNLTETSNLSQAAVNNKTESLDYLFDPTKSHDGKASYPNVTGLFRLENGYYYFDSAINFAELNIKDTDSPKTDRTDIDGNHITLYDTVWQPIDPSTSTGNPVNPSTVSRSRGQFFPFNDWSDLFHVGDYGKLVQNRDYIYYQNKPGYEQLNHYFGMTIETEFIQPINGKVNHGEDDMIFEFSGDDDVWIFVDGVLVCDIGGLHTKMDAQINFATGNVTVDGKTTTLKSIFTAAGKTSDFVGNTFASGTTHQLKFFYLERGNNVSNCRINFNFQNVEPDVIRKADENGKPLAGAEFTLYPTQLKDGVNADGQLKAEDFVDTTATEPLITVITSVEDGSAEFRYLDGKIISFADLNTQKGYEYYILCETDAPAGYRINNYIILKYHKNTDTFTVVNKYETGAYASFSAYFAQTENTVYTADYNADGTQTKHDNDPVSASALKDGLTIVVPAIFEDGKWLPLYGSNADGWTKLDGSADDKQALLKAAFYQMASDGPDMYMTWNDTTKTLSAALIDVPGNAELYIGNKPEGYTPKNGDLSQATLFLPKETLAALGLNSAGYSSSQELFDALKKIVSADKDAAVKTAQSAADKLKLLYTSSFNRTYRSDIHIIDMQQKLIIRKIDEKGNPLGGAEFALYNNAEKAAAGREEGRLITGVTGADGMLIMTFEKLEGGLEDNRRYYLREVTAPDGYQSNPNLIEVVVDGTYIFANASAYEYKGAGEPLEKAQNDNVQVYAAAGSIAANVERFADNSDVLDDIKLAEITGQVMTASGTAEGAAPSPSWVGGESFKLYFNGQNEKFKYDLLDYARVQNFDPADYTNDSEILNNLGVIKVSDGFACVKPMYGDYDLSSMFTLLNIVEVTDIPGTPEKTEEAPGNGETVMPGEHITYKIGWGNYSSKSATLTIKDPLDSKVDFVSASYNGVVLSSEDSTVTNGNVTIQYDKGNRTVIWTIDNAEPYSTVEVFLEVKVKENITDNSSVVNQAKVSNSNIKGEKTTEEVVNPVIDLDIKKDQAVNSGERTTDTLVVKAGDKVTYYMTVTVTGTEGATLDNIVVKDRIPYDPVLLDYVEGSASYSKNGVEADRPDINIENNIIEWKLGTGTVGDVYLLWYTVTVPSVDENTTWENTAYVTSGDEDPGDPPYDPDDPDDPNNPEDPHRHGRRKWKPSNTVKIYVPISNWPPQIKKDIEGRAWEEGDEFEFVLELISPDGGASENGVIMPENAAVQGAPGKTNAEFAQFGEVTFTKPGTYVFKLSEKQPDSYNGLIFDQGYYMLTVEVDYVDGDSQKDLKVIGVTAADAAGKVCDGEVYSFTNHSPSAELSVPIEKILEGKDWTDEKFEFVIAPDADTAHAIGSYIEIEKDVITLDANNREGSFELTIKPNGLQSSSYTFTVTERNSGIDGMTYAKPYTLTVDVTDENGSMTVSASYTDENGDKVDLAKGDSLIFTNRFSPIGVLGHGNITIYKELDGRDWDEDDIFAFDIALNDYKKDGETKDAEGLIEFTDERIYVYGTGSHTASFGDITFKAAGTYTFKITESKDGMPDRVTPDTREYIVTVEVTDDNSGVLAVTVTDIRLKDSADKAEKLVFVNTYEPPEYEGVLGHGSITVDKELAGRGWNNSDKFTFNIAAHDEKTAAAVDEELIIFTDKEIHIGNTVDSDGRHTASFGDITFKCIGTYTFEVTESKAGLPKNVSGSNAVYIVTVKSEIADNNSGKLTVTVTDIELVGSTDEVDKLVFVNTYKPPVTPPPTPTTTTTTTTTTPAPEPDPDPEPDPTPSVTTDEDYFNLDDDGLPRGDHNIPTDDEDYFNLDDDGLPRGDHNLPTGVVLGGSVGLTIGSLIAAAAAQAIGKRRRSKKNK